jgi:hypothetical protein
MRIELNCAECGNGGLVIGKSRLVEFLNYPVIALLVLWIQVQALADAMTYEPETASSRKAQRPGDSTRPDRLRRQHENFGSERLNGKA